MKRAISAAISALFCVSCASPSGGARRALVEAEGPRPWYTMLRPAGATPAEQLAHARALRDSGSVRRANRHYRALAASWPSSPEAPVALLERARLLDARGRAEDAFEAYQELTTQYPGLFPFGEVFGRQLAIAEGALERRRLRFLFGGFATPERAIPMLEHLARAAPSGADAARARLLLGRAHEMNDDPTSAAIAYGEIEQRHPSDPLAPEASFRRAQCLSKLSRQAPGDRRLLEDAIFAFDRFLRLYPDSDRAAAALEHRNALRARLAEMAWNEAEFYDRRSARPSSAIGPYQRFLEQFGDTEWAPRARARLEALQQQSSQEKP